MKHVQVLVQGVNIKRTSGVEILGEQSDVEIHEEGIDDWRLGDDVIAWFAIAGTIAATVSAIVAVATWICDRGGEGRVEIRQIRNKSSVTKCEWILADGETERLTYEIESATEETTIKIS